MYNEELKTKFISQYSEKISTKKTCVSVFTTCEPYEIKKNADVCTMTTEELQPIVEELLGVRISGQLNRLAVLKKYFQWCIDQHVEGATDGIFNVSIGTQGKVKAQMVSSPVHLQKYMDSFLQPESEHTLDDTYRCFFWLAFAGCPEEDAINVQTGDVDFENMVVHVGENEYPIYRESLQAFRNCVTQSWFMYIHPNYDKKVIKERGASNQLLRGSKPEMSLKILRITISKNTAKALSDGLTQMRLSYFKTWLSGIFYRTYQLELAGVEPDFTDIAKYEMAGKVYKLDKSRNLVGALERRKNREYMEDYNRWKMAFVR